MVHIHAEGPAFFAWLPKMFGKRVVVTVHGIDWQREKWQSGLGVANVLERSIAAQNLAMVRMLPCYSDLELPRGSKKVLRSLTKTTAKKLMQSDEIQFDPK